MRSEYRAVRINRRTIKGKIRRMGAKKEKRKYTERKPPNCVYPDCFNCPCKDCEADMIFPGEAFENAKNGGLPYHVKRRRKNG